MDLLSQAIRTIFYDVNIKQVVDYWKNGTSHFVKDGFVDQTVWHATDFTRTEVKQLGDFIFDTIRSESGYNSNFPWHSMFYLLPHFSKGCIALKQGIPFIKCDSHLKWRGLSSLIGEDILTTSYKAYVEYKHKPQTYSFAWPNVIDSDDTTLNAIYDKGLSDTHAHLIASAEIFELTWLDFMNNVSNRNDNYRGLLKSAEAITVTASGELTYRIDVLLQISALLRFYLVKTIDEQKLRKELCDVVRLFDNAYYRTKAILELQPSIDTASQKGLMVLIGDKEQHIDYCRLANSNNTIYSIHECERSWLYVFFLRYFKKESWAVKVANYVFLYLLLKIRVRREFIQTNALIGFDNFKTYQDRKSAYCSKYLDLYPYYAVQSSIRPGKGDTFEARVSPVIIPDKDLSVSLFDRKGRFFNINRGSLTFVVHMLKSNGEKCKPEYKGTRFGYKEEYHSQIDAIIEDAGKRIESNPQRAIYDIVGIDAAGSELICPPAVFGHVYRYARARGMVNLTYHVGEDFFDLTDGLLSVFEAITFLELGDGCRLGHASALGVDATSYYKKRMYQAIMTKQRLLDCLVGLLAFSLKNNVAAVKSIRRSLYDDAVRLYSEIGYQKPFRITTYVLSMYLRSDELSNDGIAPWSTTSICSDAIACNARNSKLAKELNFDYQTKSVIIENGKQKELYTFPKGIVPIVERAQEFLLDHIKNKGIVIESNPTSNLHIGPFEDYGSLPLFEFEKHGVRYSVNTDDKGVFATSLPTELTLVAEVSSADKSLLIDKICQENQNSRFTKSALHIK